ncbi:Hint domain-containing protein [Halocynthiibacter namhaensis]|uniref:Hint domain-containing protein n=1 Tax=Halocynthiibacter namhaensis TaxID=1290553 RepID=UPI00068B7F51|nr:Hint domain-containing protein [Halocynthiibacter namhaensis]
MAFFRFTIYAASDFTTLDFGNATTLGTITTGAILNGISIVVEDNDGSLQRLSDDSSPGVITGGDDPALVGQVIALQTPLSGAEIGINGGSQGGNIFYKITLNGNDYVVHRDSTGGSQMQANTTYNETTINPQTSLLYQQFDDGMVVCFSSEAELLCVGGPKSAGDLVIGDKVRVQNSEGEFTEAPIRYIYKRSYDYGQLQANQKLWPVRISKGALGEGLPTSDLLVSRQHRILISRNNKSGRSNPDAKLVPAIKLTDISGICIDKDVKEVTYVHFACDTHVIVVANGVYTESLFLGSTAISALSKDARTELTTIFPDLTESSASRQLACPALDGRLAHDFVKKCIK